MGDRVLGMNRTKDTNKETQMNYRNKETQMKYRNTLHDDGTITYWSVYRQSWVERAAGISDKELAAMSSAEREAAIEHLSLWR